MSGRYDFGYQVYHGSTVEWALKKIRPKSEVLEFGPFNGNLTKHLKEELLCQVDIVELDEENEVKLAKYVDEIEALISGNEIPIVLNKVKCKKCAYYEYCYI